MLHIEDDPANRLLVRKILVGAGFDVIEASDGLQGVRLARSELPDLVLVDLNIPGLDGYEVTLRLRGDPQLQHIPIVAITAQGDRSTSLAVGCDGFVHKPIHVRTFAQTIERFLRGDKEHLANRQGDAHLRAQSQRIVARLEAKVAELSEANDRLREAERGRTSFYRNISHELATPLTPIVGYVKLLRDEELGPVSPGQQKALLAMDSCVQRLRLLIDNLLEVTGLEAGTMSFCHGDYDVGELAQQAVDRIEQQAKQREVRVVLECEQTDLAVWGDGPRLVRGLVQLLDNAVKFTPVQGVVGLRVARRGAQFEFCVADNGPGIAPEHVARVLEPFVQVDSSPTRKHQGVGIGLAIARRVAVGLGGDLRVESPCSERIGGERFRSTACVMMVAERAPTAGGVKSGG